MKNIKEKIFDVRMMYSKKSFGQKFVDNLGPKIYDL